LPREAEILGALDNLLKQANLFIIESYIMSDKAWLKQVLADANASNQSRPDWAKNSSARIALNSRAESSSHSESSPTTSDSNEKKVWVKMA